jgi:UDP-N-acetylmuramate dehydrogenase
MQIQENVQLAKYTSFKIGGNARFFIEVKNRNDFKEAIAFAREKNLNYFILGGGTNCLIRESGFNGVVIRNQMRSINLEDSLIIAETALTLPEIHNFANKNGMVGFEKLATVPGTLGGAIYNNAHYIDSLFSNFVEWLEILNPESGQIERLVKDEMQFEYDNSKVKKFNLPALAAAIKLPKGDVSESRKLFLEFLKKRSAEQPYGTFNSGCIFQNVKENLGPGHNGTSAGFLIEQCGLKGLRFGDAIISEKHGNFFINSGQAKSEDILKLAEICKNKVKEKFGVNLEYEIKII